VNAAIAAWSTKPLRSRSSFAGCGERARRGEDAQRSMIIRASPRDLRALVSSETARAGVSARSVENFD
jgi:hypothetical protein